MARNERHRSNRRYWRGFAARDVEAPSPFVSPELIDPRDYVACLAEGLSRYWDGARSAASRAPLLHGRRLDGADSCQVVLAEQGSRAQRADVALNQAKPEARERSGSEL